MALPATIGDPSTPPKRPVYELIAAELATLGVERVFGLMAEDTSVLTSEFEVGGIAYQPAKHENVAVSMAAGYAWARDAFAVAIVGRGPGLTNAATALANAARARCKLLVLTTQASSSLGPWRGDLKAIDQVSFASSIGLDYVVPGAAEDVVDTLRAAVAAARQGHPTLFAVPMEVLPALAPAPAPDLAPDLAPEPVEPSAADVDRVLEILEGSKRPLVLAGAGALGARDVLIELAERSGALLATTLMSKDLFRGHRLDLRVMGGFATETARDLVPLADCVLAFGASLNIFTRGHGMLFEDATIVAVDIDPERIGLQGRVDVGVVADAGVAATRLLERMPEGKAADAPFHEPEVLGRVASPEVFNGYDEHSDDYTDPRALSLALDELLPPERQVVTDAGHYLCFPGTAIRGLGPRSYRQMGDFIAVGMGIGAAVGAALARPKLTTVLAIGDGGLAMTFGDLEPLARFQHPVVIVVYNDQAYGAERHFLDIDGRSHELALVPDVDFAAVATAMGIEGVTIRSLDDLRSVAPRLSGRGTPMLLDCKINPRVRGRYVDDVDGQLPSRVAAAVRS